MLVKFGSILFVSAFVLSGCSITSGDAADGGGGGGKKAQRLNWEAVPSNYNPSIESHDFGTYNASKLKVDMFGYSGDVELVYSGTQAANTVSVQVYKVWAKQASWGNVNSRTSNNELAISNSGSYQCSIQIKDGNITRLEGGCYVRILIVLPIGAQLEVYNSGVLISNRFIAMSTSELIAGVDRASFAKEKLQVIDSYNASNSAVGRGASLASNELEQVLRKFSFDSEKIEALSRLQAAVNDRYNLGAMIDRIFAFNSGRDQARRICGI